ncbi:AAA domain-containing protein [Trichoderma simmonsii]|uniref:AAA domain-containing protein n=1 Tax=Trichoderma simmonsii TaxID=1491479 RepID=A0A8G0PIY8_9HYPO|nr:AAA domain-containing protein [Trichoderma simmonsii]
MRENPQPVPPSFLGVDNQDDAGEAPRFSFGSKTDGAATISQTSGNSTSEIEALKLRIAELEMRTQNDAPTPSLSQNTADAGVKQGNNQPKVMANLERYKRMEECLYLHRKEWESDGGPATWSMNEFSDRPEWREQIGQYGPWRYLWEVQSDKKYERPDPFDRYHVCEAGHDKQNKPEYDEYDRTIDYGYRRERLRKNFEWDLDRLFLAEEMERRRQGSVLHKPKASDIHASNQKMQQFHGDDAEAMEEASLIFYAAPEIKRLDWPGFKPLANSLEKDAHAIDVLIGEPIIEDSNLGQSLNWFDSQPRQHQKPDWLRDGKFAQDVAAGLVQLPERIRINSTILRKAMAKILGSDGQSLDDTGEGSVSVIFTRPFKAITYCEPTLRQWHAELEKKHNKVSISTKEDTVVSDTSPLSPQQTVQETAVPPVSVGDEHLGKDLTSESIIDELDTASSDEARQKKEEEQKEGNAQSDADSLKAIGHLECILKFIDSDILARKAALDGIENHKAFYSDLWHLFRPGTEVIRADGKQAYRVIRTSSAAHRFVNTRSWWDNITAQKRSTSFLIDCVYIDFDGTNLGPVYAQFSIKIFEGEKEVTSFEVYPLRFHRTKRADFSDSEWDQVQELPSGERFRQKLINRGAKFMSVIPMKHMYYSGLTLGARDEVESQVVIDFDIPSSIDAPDDPSKPIPRDKEKWKPEIRSVITKLTDPADKGSKGDLGQKTCHGPCCYGEFVYDDTFIDQKEATEYIESLVPKTRAIDDHSSVAISPRPLKEVQADTSGVGSISNDELVIMTHRVFGFVLRSRKWAKLDLSYITDVHSSIPIEITDNSAVEPNTDETEPSTALDRLVLEEGHRNMIVSLISQHFREKALSRSQKEEFDIVKGKGKGLILLLHGAPGVGKTSTAEGVAELFQKPLLQITCGDLGSTAREVEEALETNFAMASKWGCILLLDEADIFLAERTREDYVRNGLVAVFLRTLEYYNGILFLTTNRVGDFDEAFTSRIHVSLYYPELDHKKTIQVFKLNLEMIEKRIAQKGKTIQLDKTDICMFAGEHFMKHEHARWNGRQIRNACQTALALAEFEAQGNNHKAVQIPNAAIKLEVRHFSVVQDAYLEFAKYMNDLYGTNAARRAKEARLRALWELERNINLMDKSSFMMGAQNQPQASSQRYPPSQQGFRPPNFQQQSFSQQSQHHGFPPNQFYEQQPPSHQNPNMAMPQPMHSNNPQIHVQEELPGRRSWDSQSAKPFGASEDENRSRELPRSTPIPYQQQQQGSQNWVQQSVQSMYEGAGNQDGFGSSDGDYSLGTRR